MAAPNKQVVLGGLTAVLLLAAPLVQKYEGYSASAYLDPVGIPTICYGYTPGVRLGMIRSKERCQLLLEGELSKAVAVVDAKVKVQIPNTRRAALASFVYNVGEGNFSQSRLLKKLNARDAIGACNELRRWVYAKGKKLPGLVKRREAERELCLMEDPIVVAHAD